MLLDPEYEKEVEFQQIAHNCCSPAIIDWIQVHDRANECTKYELEL